ncbi:MAG: hypothetical protein AAF985_21635 [Bacteroidota bacterium]
MNGKSLVLVLFWALFLVCGFQYFLLFPTTCIEHDLDEKAHWYALQAPDNRQHEVEEQLRQHYFDSISNEVVFAIPYLFDFTYAELKQQQLQLGLDLKGGMAFTLGIDMASSIKSLLLDEEDEKVQWALQEASKQTSVYSIDFLSLFLEHYQAIEQHENIIRNFMHHPQLRQQLDHRATIHFVETQIRTQVQQLVERTAQSIRVRCDALGLLQLQIRSDRNRTQIEVEFPTGKDPGRIRKLLTQRSSLAFWPTYRITDPGIRAAFVQADQLLDTMEPAETISEH